MTAPRWEPTDAATGSLLDLLAADWLPFAEADRNLVARAIRDDAEAHDGHVSANRVRRRISGKVDPRRVGPVYRALALAGTIRAEGWEVSDDRLGRNAGRPARTYRWVGEPPC
jgi:hypothetical protein